MDEVTKAELAAIRRELADFKRHEDELAEERAKAVALAFAASKSSYLSRSEAGWVVMAIIAIIVAATGIIVAFR